MRFSELQPPRLPNNTFSYHLKKLVESGYITSSHEGYTATRKALKTIQYSGHQVKKNVAPALITIVYVTDDHNNVLLLKRDSQPFTAWYGIPSGLVHLGETLGTAAQRELLEKTGIVALQPLDFVGVLDFKYLERESGDLFVHAVSFVYKYTCSELNLVLLSQSSQYGELYWSDLTHEKILPEVHMIANLVKSGGGPVTSSVDFEEPTAG
jgi:ADP-ribose pyrophosphatase YjhB (NUDIX family)